MADVEERTDEPLPEEKHPAWCHQPACDFTRDPHDRDPRAEHAGPLEALGTFDDTWNVEVVQRRGGGPELVIQHWGKQVHHPVVEMRIPMELAPKIFWAVAKNIGVVEDAEANADDE